MNVSAVAGMAQAMQQNQTANEIQTTLMRKVMDMSQQHAAQMLAAIPTAAQLPSHLGQNVNVVA